VTARPVQLNDAAFLMLRKAIANVDAETGFPLGPLMSFERHYSRH
jgi:hypothetical protein